MFSLFGFMGTKAAGGDADADAYIAAVITAGGTLSGTEEGAIQTLFTDLKTAGVYDEMFAFYPVIGGLEATHALNGLRVSSSFDLSFTGGWTHASSGMKPNGTNAYADTSVIYGTPQINNNTYGIYVADSGSGQAYAVDGGVISGIDYWHVCNYWSATGAGRFTNDWNDSVAITTKNGNLMINMRDAATNAELWSNGSLDATISNNVGGGTTGTRSFFLGAINNDGGGAASWSYSAREQIFSFFHRRALTSTEIGDISTAINDYQTTLGRNTY